jgi:hypothetical protein
VHVCANVCKRVHTVQLILIGSCSMHHHWSRFECVLTPSDDIADDAAHLSYIAGAGSDVTAIYFAYDNPTTAPLAYFAPDTPGGSWGMRDLTIYVLSFYYNVIHVPASASGRFRATNLTIRADAFHNKNGVGGVGPNGGNRAPLLFLRACLLFSLLGIGTP